MKVQILASGSRGNCTLVETENTKILIDLGIVYTRVSQILESQDIHPQTDINGILITHTHSDHIKGLEVFVKKTNCLVYIPDGMQTQLERIVPKKNMVLMQENFPLGDFKVNLIHTSHDATPSVGFIITADEKSLVYITDTGYLNQRYLDQIHNKTMYVLESNHDEKMLMEGPYPYHLKQRVLSDKGHLSNATAARYLEEVIGPDTKCIILAHLSEKNNTEQIALETLQERLGSQLQEKTVLLARQDESLDLIEV